MKPLKSAVANISCIGNPARRTQLTNADRRIIVRASRNRYGTSRNIAIFLGVSQSVVSAEMEKVTGGRRTLRALQSVVAGGGR